MFVQILAPIFYVILFTTIIYRWRFFHLSEIGKRWMIGAFWLKILAGFFFWLVYTQYYTNPSESDALRYFDDALTIKRQWNENRDVFWSFMLGRNMDNPEYVKIYDQLIAWTSGYRYGLSNDCSTIIRINVLLSFISFESFHVHAAILSFMAFTGFTAMFRAFRNMFLSKEKWLFAACFLLPSVVFWSSSVLKEGPLFLFLGLLLQSLVIISEDRKRYFQYLVFGISFVLLIYTKVYVIISLIPALFSLIVIRISGQRMIVLKFLVSHIVCFFLAQNAHYFFRGGDYLYVLHKKQTDFYNVAFMRDAGSVVDIPPVSSTANFFMNYPQAFFLTYFRPHILEAKSLVYFLFAMENVGYLLLVIVTLIFIRKPAKKDLPHLLLAFSYLLVLASILGNCVPILGAMVRYKVVGLPLLVILCFALLDSEKLKNFLKQMARRLLLN